MAEAILSMTQETLRNLLIEEVKFLYGVTDQVEEIHFQLEIMKSYLKDADRRQHTQEAVRTWVKQLRRLAYRTEDVLETYVVEVASEDHGAGWCIENVLKRFAFILCHCFALHNVGKEIEKILSDINVLKEDRVKLGIQVLDGGQSSNEANERQQFLRQTYAHNVEEDFVGMEDDIQTLVSLITDNQRDHRVISIWGIGGLGKTTLATKIFNHEVVQRSFGAFAWVCISQQSQIDKVLQDILKQIIKEDRRGVDHTALVTELHEVLKTRKCLVVVDDIWQQDDWKILSSAFPLTNTRSKFLLTTRSRDVAKNGFPYELKTLTEEESWVLLQKKALTTQEGEDLGAAQEFEDIGKKIVRKCGYLPLAISTIGGILRERDSLEDWTSVIKNIAMYLFRGEDEEGDSNNSIMNILALSYNKLPYYLKPCFLHMGNFREDESMDAKKLYQLWIAEGLVLEEHCRTVDKSMMDVAERYLGMLASRSMVEVEMDDMSTISRFKSCRLHDLMRELCLTKGKKEEFLDVIDVQAQDLTNMDLSSLFHNHNVHRLAMNVFDDGFIHVEGLFFKVSQQLKAQVFRTLSVRNYSSTVDLGDLSGLKKFKLLRVFRLEGWRFELPEEISELTRLRYLSLEGSFVSRLPVSISKMSCLQTLDLRVYNERIDLPDIFWKMRRLKHIYLPSSCDGRLSGNLQFNSELEILSGYRSEDGVPPYLSELVNLRYFSGLLRDNKALYELMDTIFSWRKIEWVHLQVFNNIEFISEEGSSLLRKVFSCINLIELDLYFCPVHHFPPYEPQFLPNLRRLLLDSTKIENDPMQFLAQLPNLRELEFSSNVFMGKEMVCDATAFPQLRSLTLYGLPNLEMWRVYEGAMPNLSSVLIGACPKLKTISNGLNFCTIKKFTIRKMSKEFEETYRTLHEQARSSMVSHG